MFAEFKDFNKHPSNIHLSPLREYQEYVTIYINRFAYATALKKVPTTFSKILLKVG